MPRLSFKHGILLAVMTVTLMSPIYGQNDDYSLESLKAQAETSNSQPKLITRLFSVPHTDATTLARNLQHLYPDIKISVDADTHSILAQGTSKELHTIAHVINSADKVPEKIQFDVAIIEINSAKAEEYKSALTELGSGLFYNYDAKTGGIEPGNSLLGQFMGMINSGAGEILAKPSLLVNDGQNAEVRVGERIPFVSLHYRNNERIKEVQYLDVGIKLLITPRVNTNDNITTQITVEMTAIKQWKNQGDVEYPVLSSRHTNTVVRLKNDDTLVIAGLLDSSTKTSIRRVPILSAIPLIGRLFKSKTTETVQTEMVVLITPHLIRETNKAVRLRQSSTI
ncbi:MAG: type II and III secretion system protein [bacterium]|nr:type II and III secretion system protein [bacterium]